MAPITFDIEIPSSIPAHRMFKAFVLDSDKLLPKIFPQAIKSGKILQGNGRAGSIKLFTFNKGSHDNLVKYRVDEIDTDNFTYNYTMIEGDELMGVFESIEYQKKIVPTPEGGCILKSKSIYHVKAGAKVTKEETEASKEAGKAMFKAVEAYLLANPDA